MTLPAEIVYGHRFDVEFFALPVSVQEEIDAKTVWLATRLDTFPHKRLQGSRAFRLRVGVYRVIYTFDPGARVLYLATVGHRREIYSDL